MRKLFCILGMIKLEHSIFALPFAAMGALLAERRLPDVDKIFWILVAMFSARSSAMAFNRIVDARLDATNPRTALRPIPAGKLAIKDVQIFTICSSCLFVLSAYMLNPLCLYLSPLALFIILFYSYTKRFTYLTHLFLGLSLGLAPIGGWIGVKGSLEILPLVISSGVILWVAGFDIIYACQDLDFDRRSGLYSIPQSFGLKRGLFISFLLHMCAVIIFMGVLPLGGLGIFYGISVVMVLGLFIYEHLLVSPFDLRRVNQAFFYVNSSISLLLMCGCILDLFLEI